jgi:hypothetical protein
MVPGIDREVSQPDFPGVKAGERQLDGVVVELDGLPDCRVERRS